MVKSYEPVRLRGDETRCSELKSFGATTVHRAFPKFEQLFFLPPLEIGRDIE
jgi:hypothetical protein